MVHLLLKPGLENFEHYFTRVWDECNCVVVWAFFGIAFLGNGMKTALSSPVVNAEYSKFVAILVALSQHHFFRICNNLTGIPSPPLALFTVMLPRTHLTLHSRMSGSRWVITPLWLSKSLRSFLYSSVYPCHFYLISSASIRTIPFLSFFVLIFAWNVPLVSPIFLKRYLVFPILLFSSISLHWSLRKAFLALLTIHWNTAFKWIHLSFSPLP